MILQYLFLISCLACTIFGMDSSLSFQSDTLDTETNTSANITIQQSGNDNSVHIRQTDSASNKHAEIRSKGSGNHVELDVDGNPLTTDITFLGDSNQLITFSEGILKLQSVTSLNESFLQEHTEFSTFYLLLINPKAHINIHSSPTGVTIYR